MGQPAPVLKDSPQQGSTNTPNGIFPGRVCGQAIRQKAYLLRLTGFAEGASKIAVISLIIGAWVSAAASVGGGGIDDRSNQCPLTPGPDLIILHPPPVLINPGDTVCHGRVYQHHICILI